MAGELCSQLADWLFPLLLAAIPLFGRYRRVAVYDAFVEGAGAGVSTVVRIMPCLLAMMTAAYMLRASGALAVFVDLAGPLFSSWGVPPELLPLVLLRPLSGSGSLGLVTEIFHTYGPDSLLGVMASVLVGSTDTTLYVIAVYLGSVGIRHTRYAAAVGLLGDAAGFIGTMLVCRYFFS